SLLHLSGPDASGHASGWGSDPYKSAIEAMDAELGRIFDMLDNTPALQGKTALILTSDHGGGGGWLMGHTAATHPDNFTIPFYVCGPGVAKTDLYALNQLTRTDPESDNNPAYLSDSATMPIRNGAVANLALSLLKLPPVPGSWINSNQDLVIGDSSGIEFVIAISVDGLRPKEIQELGEEKLPNLYRFRKEGAWTDNARTDVSHTLTLPNHTSMITGRGVQDFEGVGQGHRQTANYYSTGTLHQNIGGIHMASIYDVVHDNGLRTGLFANKSKFNLFSASYENVDTGISDSIELFNPTGEDVDLGGWFLSDSEKNLKKYQIPEGTILKDGDYLVFNEKNFNSGYGANPTDFALSGSNGDEVFLSQADSAGNLIRLVDSVDFGPSPEGGTLGRDSNGSGSFRAQAEPSLGDGNGEYRVGDLVLNEVMYLPDGYDDLEYLELYNTGGETIYLDNWSLEGVGEFIFPQGQTLGPRSLLVLLRFDPAFSANISRKTAFEAAYGITIGSQFIGGYPGGLGNSSDELKISRPGEQFFSEPDRFPLYLEDEVAYANLAPWPELQTGQPLHRSNPNGWGSSASNWSAGPPSPGSLAVQKSFKEWATSRLPGIENPNVEEDLDLDGLSNLLEFALGLNPATNDVDSLPFIENAAFDGLVTMVYQMDRAAGGIDFRMEYTRNLAIGWESLATADFVTRDELVNLKGTVETRQLLLPASEKILFLRILIDH
ncbi:MAG: lamin tail domain-containing protein, partial [Opitutales bacterium]|nr:lamin tail domain-containing protein [Opitutales bacterium]